MTKPNPLRAWRTAQTDKHGEPLSLRKFAYSLGVTKTTLARWETDRIPADVVPDLEKITGIPREKLRPDLWKKS